MKVGYRTIILAGALCAALTHPATARTWVVELDGSADFTDIQPAVDAAAVGDTIRIGPGRFATFHPVVAPGWTEEAVVVVTKDELTFIGSGRDVTFIGPTSYYGALADRPKGFCSVLPAVSGAIRELTIENIETSVYWAYGRIDIENCRMAGSGHGFLGLSTWAEGGSVTNCRFETSVGGIGCFLATASDILISNCEFLGWGSGVSAVNGSQNIVVESCAFDRSVSGVAFSWQSSGIVRDCQMTRIQEYGISLYDNCSVDISRVAINSWNRGLHVVASSLTGADIVIENTSTESVLACCNSTITISNSQFIPRAGLAVRCEGRWTAPSTLELSGNYWGTTDSQAISDMILDGTDEPSINCTVQFEPFAGGPLPTESASWGGVKAMFR